MSLFTFLTAAFILAKIFNIDPVSMWSWWVVLAPTWIPLVFIAVMAILSIVFGDETRPRNF